MGKIKPSPEAIDIFMHSGDQMLKRVKFKLNTIGMEDTFYAISLTTLFNVGHIGTTLSATI